MGLKYKKATALVPSESKVSMSFVLTKAGHKRNAISGVVLVNIVDGDKTIPVYGFPSEKKPYSSTSQGKIPVKKIKGMAKLGK